MTRPATGLDKKRAREVLARASGLATPLWKDVTHLMRRASFETRCYNAGCSELEDFLFWHKAVVRSFFSSVDALCYFLRSLVREEAGAARLELGAKTARRLEDGGATISMYQSFRLAFRWFPRLFGLDRNLDLSTADWRAFLRLAAARRRLTHPQGVADLRPFEIFQVLGAAIEWFFHEWKHLLLDCAEVAGVTIRETVGNSERLHIASDEGAESMPVPEAPEGLSPIDELTEVMFPLMRESGYALGVVNETVRRKPAVPKDTALRLLFATLLSEIEGTMRAVRAFRARVEGGEVDASFLVGPHDAVREAIAREAEMFSEKFGGGVVLSRKSAGWAAFVPFRERRNEFIHPRSLETLRVSIADLDLVVGALSWWHDEVHKCLSLSTEPKVGWL